MFFIIIGLYLDSAFTQPISNDGIKFTLSQEIFDFGKVAQIWLRNEWDRNLKNEYLFISYDATDSLYGQRFCSLSNYDGTNKTVLGKLYLKNVDLQPLESEMFQVHFEPLLGITSQEGLVLNIVSTNNVVNQPIYSLTP